MTDENTQNFDLKRMLRYLRKYYSFKIGFAFSIKNTKKTTTLQQVTCEETPNLVLRKMQELSLKISPLNKVSKF